MRVKVFHRGRGQWCAVSQKPSPSSESDDAVPLDPLMYRALAPYYLGNAGFYGRQCLTMLAREGSKRESSVDEIVQRARLAASYGLDAMNWR